MKFFYLAFLFCFSPILHVNAGTPKSVTCTRSEYREEYIPGTKSNPGYVKSYEVDVVVPCGGHNQAEKIDDNDCSEGSLIGGILGAGIALSSSRGKDRLWAVPAGGTAGALIGCQVDGG
ncbi:MAG: glycine zipper 2TM domain-containing protein [Prochlorococcus marinus CUG1431]|uniref:Glycine zipper 2TM domain-containing protein n=1 Tax=Prochlorococcus marinus CUG1433 TaxID=2774506 RepID=A0A9D9G2F6_PROMR|nr:glycine zipper 2TM domain-containing protein [Prochlorococcus marinus CUG1433]MBO6980881.1 glycine zipper 2TM domain-containing protein [Prochlorococcus marinus CUG1431]